MLFATLAKMRLVDPDGVLETLRLVTLWAHGSGQVVSLYARGSNRRSAAPAKGSNDDASALTVLERDIRPAADTRLSYA